MQVLDTIPVGQQYATDLLVMNDDGKFAIVRKHHTYGALKEPDCTLSRAEVRETWKDKLKKLARRITTNLGDQELWAERRLKSVL